MADAVAMGGARPAFSDSRRLAGSQEGGPEGPGMSRSGELSGGYAIYEYRPSPRSPKASKSRRVSYYGASNSRQKPSSIVNRSEIGRSKS